MTMRDNEIHSNWIVQYAHKGVEAEDSPTETKPLQFESFYARTSVRCVCCMGVYFFLLKNLKFRFLSAKVGFPIVSLAFY